MRTYTSYHPEWATIMQQELANDPASNWMQPKSNADFNKGKMRFVNRNINYFYYESMISLALKNQYEFNPNYPKILEFCEYIRSLIGEAGPFGRMSIWNLPAKADLLPHYDNWPYHRVINRYIFSISDHSATDVLVKIDTEEVAITPGILFRMHPCREKHEFVNYTDKDWHFLAIDYWIPDRLIAVAAENNITAETEIYYEPGFGYNGKKTKYASAE